MKKIIILLISAVCFSFMTVAQVVPASQVPAVVKKTFLTKFTKASDLEWEKSGANYVAQFVSGNDWISATFSALGVWLETNSAIEAAALPSVVSAAVKKANPGWDISSVSLIDKANIGKQYAIQIDKDEESYSLIYKADGTFVSKAKMEMETEEEYTDEG